MPQLSLLLDARNVDDASIDDPLTFVRVAVPDGSRSAEKRLMPLPGVPVRVTFSDGPSGSPLALRVSPSRYRDGQVFADLDGDGRVTPKAPIRLPRRPGEWLPVFTQWAALSADFGDLQEALRVSDTFRLGRHSDPEQLVDDRYDAVDPQDESRALAKLSLLNLYARLREEPIPGSDTTWFSTVEKLIVATRERFMAIVTEDCFDAVQQLSKKGKSGYHHSNPGPHKKNFTELAGASDVKKHAAFCASAGHPNPLGAQAYAKALALSLSPPVT